MTKTQIFHIIQVIAGLLIPIFPFPIILLHISVINRLMLLFSPNSLAGGWFSGYLIVGIVIVLLLRLVKIIPAFTFNEIAFFAVPYLISSAYFTYRFS